MKCKMGLLTAVFSMFVMGAIADVWLNDDFDDGSQSNIWAVFGNTNSPAVLEEVDGVLQISARGVDDDGTLGYITTSTYPWQDTGTSYVFSLWISNISVTAVSSTEFSQQAFISLLSESNKHYMATNAMTLYANYFPGDDELELAMATKTNRYTGGGAYGSMGNWRYSARITNYSGVIAAGPIRMQMTLRSGVLSAGVYDKYDQPIPVNRVMGKPAVVHGLDQLYNPLIMIGAGNSVQGRGSVQLDKFEVTTTAAEEPGQLFFDDFNDEATYNFWSWMPDGTTWGLEESNGVMAVYPVFWTADDTSKFLASAEPMVMDLQSYGYEFSANLSTVRLVSGTGERSMLMLSDSPLDPWLATNVIYLAGSYANTSDTWTASLYIESQGGAGYGSLRFSGILTNFSSYAASGGLDIHLVLTNGMYDLRILDSASNAVPFGYVAGSLSGVHGLDAGVFTSVYWCIGAQNIGVTDGKVMWGETSGRQFDVDQNLWFNLYDDFELTNTLSWWQIITGTWASGGTLSQLDGRLYIKPGYIDDILGGYVSTEPFVMGAPSVSYIYKASLSTAQVEIARTWGSEVRGAFFLTPASDQDFWASPVAATVLCEYEESNDWMTVYLYTKTNIVSSLGLERFHGVITSYNERVQSDCLTVQLTIQDDEYTLSLQDGSGAAMGLDYVSGAMSGAHNLGGTLNTCHWFVGCQNMSAGRGAMWWDDVMAYKISAGGTPGDMDADGIPDWWELAYFGSETGATAQDDTDGDSYNNYAEYIALTVPTNPTSFFRAGGAQPITSGGDHAMSISWWAMTGRVYDVQYTIGSISNDVQFQSLDGAEDLTPVGSNQYLTVTDTNISLNAQRVYRIRGRLPE